MLDLQSKWFIGSEDGCLYDTSRPDWWTRPVRREYAKHKHDIKCGRDLRACLRAGDFAWPGGYAIVYITSDGGALSAATVRDEYETILTSIRLGIDDGWRVVALTTTADCDEEVIDDHTGAAIE